MGEAPKRGYLGPRPVEGFDPAIDRMSDRIDELEAEIERLREQIDRAHNIIGSEAMIWLIVGANHPKAHLDAMRPAVNAYWEMYGNAFRGPKMKNSTILHLLREDQKNNPDQSQAMLSGYAADKIELLLSSIDNLLEDIDTDHQPEWTSEEARQAGKDPWCCVTCGPAEGSWPCVHRMALNELKAIRNE